MSRAQHLFVFAPGVYGSLSVEEIEATKAGLEEVGLYRMPYDRDVYIEISAIEVMGADPGVDPDHGVVYGPFGRDQVCGLAVHVRKTGQVTESVAHDPASAAFLESMLISLMATKNADKRTTESKPRKARHRQRRAALCVHNHDLTAWGPAGRPGQPTEGRARCAASAQRPRQAPALRNWAPDGKEGPGLRQCSSMPIRIS